MTQFIAFLAKKVGEIRYDTLSNLFDEFAMLREL
jgi:hypothetical protein